jgi:hypothetical protein
MVGQKSSLDVLKSELNKAGVADITQTEFCQGNVTRWGLAWTFLPEVSLEVMSKKKKKRRKEKPPFKYVVPIPDDPVCYTVSTVTSKLKAIFTQLQVQTIYITLVVSSICCILLYRIKCDGDTRRNKSQA